MKKPNILLLFADDQRFDTISALGHRQIKTPNLDLLMADGIAFTNAHIPGGTSGAVCMPSRAMLNTGRSLFELKAEGQTIPREHMLLGEKLQSLGYETFGSGKWHNSPESFARSFTDGDSIFFGGMSDHWSVPFYHYDETGKYDKTIRYCSDFTRSNETYVNNANYMRAGEHSTDIIAESLINFLDKKHDKPFYAYGAFLAPHDPRTMPEEFMRMYDDIEIEIPPNFQSQHHIEYGNLDCRDEVLAPYPRTLEDTKQQIKEYYAMISHLDHQVGRVIDKLKSIGEWDNTIVIYAADNGLAVGQHGLFGKQSLYDHSVRVPLIFAGNGIKCGIKNESLVYLYDIFPTLCELIDTDIPDTVTGNSFVKCINENKSSHRDSLYLSYIDKIRGIRDGDYKYTEHRHGGITTAQLFNVKSDPYEMANLVNTKEYIKLADELRQKMHTLGNTENELSTVHGKGFWG